MDTDESTDHYAAGHYAAGHYAAGHYAAGTAIIPDWPAPVAVHALCTSRTPINLPGGTPALAAPRASGYDSFNLAQHVGDDPSSVARNRARLHQTLNLPEEPVWLHQVHGTRVLDDNAIDAASSAQGVTAIEADGALSARRGRVLTILTADCIPLLMTDRSASFVAAVHVGWRGLVDGIVSAAVELVRRRYLSLQTQENDLRFMMSDVLVWIGPGISKNAFEVGADVLDRARARDPNHARSFEANGRGRWQCDLADMIGRELHAAGPIQVTYSGHCTFAESDSFYSYRRDGQTGRMASLIWIV